MNAQLARARDLTRYTQDFPKPGILFRDVTPVLADGAALQAVTADIVDNAPAFDVVAGVEARGFLIAGAIAAATKTGALAVRKAGKLPAPSASASYELEYGTATIEVQQDIPPGSRVLIVDDALATGGTALAAAQVLRVIGAEVVGLSVLHEISGLNGRAALGELPLHVVFPNGEA